MKFEFIKFLTDKEVPPRTLSLTVKKDVTLGLRGPAIVTKFIFWQILGALFSLSVCPQFGLGLVEGHGVTHVFRMIGDWACAAFCGSVFLTSGALVAFIGMQGEELWWVWRHHRQGLVFLPAILWGFLMLINRSLELPQEGASYHLIWIAAAALMQLLLLQGRSLVFQWELRSH